MNITEINGLKEERIKAVEEARAILDKADSGKRDLTDEEDGKYSEIIKEAQKFGKKIEREESLLEEERRVADEQARHEEENKRKKGGKSGKSGKSGERTLEERQLHGFRTYLSEGALAIPRADEEDYQEFRDLSSGVGTDGGYLVTPEKFVDELIEEKKNMVIMRQLATVHTVDGAESLGAPSLERRPDDADWSAEISEVKRTELEFGKRELTPHLSSKEVAISQALLRRAPRSETIVRDQLAYKFGVTEEKAFLTGSGTRQPLGVFVSSDEGISSARDFSTDNTATAITTDGLKTAKFGLKMQHRMTATWIFHRDGMMQLSKLKDPASDQGYIWAGSAREGEPDMLLGLPYKESEYVPNTFTTGQYVGILGNFMNYWIADDSFFQIQRLLELYARTNQVGIIGRQYCDGMPVLEEAFARVTLG